MSRPKGFTIVELLIVIVVIAILASISIVSYNGVQGRAQMAKTSTAVRSYLNALSIFKSDNGTYPSYANVSGIDYFNCIGDSYTNDMCVGSSGPIPENTPLNTRLKAILGSTLPMPGTYGGITIVLYVNSSSDPVNSGYTIDGKQTSWLAYATNSSSTPCPIGPVASFNGSFFSSTPPANNQTFSGANPQCWIPLTN